MRFIVSTIVFSLILAGSAFARELPDDISELRQLAEQGDAEAQNRLGDRYNPFENLYGIIGRGVTADKAEAIKWYTKAAEQGFRSAQGKLCFLYAKLLNLMDIADVEAEDGSIIKILPAEGTKDEVAGALKWCGAGASVPDVDSSYPTWALGTLYARGGAGLKPDLEEGYFWLTMGPKGEFFEAVKSKLTEQQRKAVEARLLAWHKAHTPTIIISPPKRDTVESAP